jgi:hypothetical protein
MNIIELQLITKRCDDEVLYAHNLLLSEERTRMSLHILSTCTTLMTNDLICHQRVGVTTNRAYLEALNDTPPQVDISTYRNTDVCVKTPDVRTERNLPSLLALFRLFVVLPAKFLLSCSSGTFIVFHALEASSQRTFLLLCRSIWKPWCTPALRKHSRAFFAALFSMDEREDGLSVLLT